MIEAQSETITTAVTAALEKQSDDIVTEEPVLIANLTETSISMNAVAATDRDTLIAEFDKIWLPKALTIIPMREMGSTH